jgi:glycogen(starch) synthase
MRVLFWSDLFWPYIGGAEYFGAKLVLALRRRGYEFLVLTSHDYLDLPDETDYGGIPIHRLPFLQTLRDGDATRFIEICQKVKSLRRNFKPALVHLNGISSTTVFHLRTRDVEPTTSLVRINQELLPNQRRGYETIFTQTLRSVGWATCVSSTVLKQASQLVPEIEGRSSVIYNGLEDPLFPPAPLSFEMPCLLCVGRLVPAKGFDLALAALALIIEKYPNIRMLIAGDGPERRHLEQRAAQLGLSDVVEFLGLVEPEKVLALVNRATLVLVPSRHEGLPTVALQASLMARPVVATRVGGLMEAIIDRETGLLIASGDSHGLAEAIAFLLSNRYVATKMGMAGRNRTQKLFLWQRCVDAYDALYRKLICTADAGRSFLLV